jgi:hypothetical protein
MTEPGVALSPSDVPCVALMLAMAPSGPVEAESSTPASPSVLASGSGGSSTRSIFQEQV